MSPGEPAGAASTTGAAPYRLFDAYILDLDGTVYLGEELLPGARRALQELRRQDRAVRFLSNNPTHDRAAYVAKLSRLGVQVSPEEVVNTVVTMTDWLLEHAPGATVYPIAETPLIEALRAAGIRLSEDPTEIDYVISSYDRTFTYRKLQIAFDAIWVHKRAQLIATNPDRFCPFPGGRGEPDAAALTAAIQACTGAPLLACTGKPDPVMLETALRGLEVPRHDCVMVGDRLTTDIRMALDAELPSALVLTGETRAGDLDGLAAGDRPTFVLDRLDRLLPAAIWQEQGWTG